MSHYFTNENLKSNIKKVLVKVSDNTFTFNTDNGVFSKKGSALTKIGYSIQ